MKRKKIVILFCLLAFSLFLSSCIGAGLCAIPLHVKVYIQKEDASTFTKAELNSFKYTTSSNGFVTGGTANGKLKPAKEDGSILIQYHLGSARYEWKLKKIAKSYPKKMKEFWFKIEDPNGVYETYEMKPLNDSYEIVEGEEKDARIKYTIKLKKKASSEK